MKFGYCVLASMCLGVVASGGTVVAPAGLNGVEGDTLYGYCCNELTAQQLYGASVLVGLNAGDQITGMHFRMNGGGSPNPAIDNSQWVVWLGPSNYAPGALTTDVAGNQGAGTYKVLDGPVNFAAGAFPSGGTPNDWGPRIGFGTPYTYTGGDLLLTLTYQTPTSEMNWDVGTGIAATDYGQADGFATATLAFTYPTAALAIEFDTVPGTATPEPGTAGLLAAGLAAAVWLKRSA